MDDGAIAVNSDFYDVVGRSLYPAPGAETYLYGKGAFTKPEVSYKDLQRALQGHREFNALPKSEQERIQREKAFKNWFGDSKVIDANGKPLVVYHGTTADITKFNQTDGGSLGDGIYFTDDAGAASTFATRKGQAGANVLPVYLSVQNLLDEIGRAHV